MIPSVIVLALVMAGTVAAVRTWAAWPLPAQLTFVTVTPLLALAAVQVSMEHLRARGVVTLWASMTVVAAWTAVALTARALDMPFSALLLWPCAAIAMAVAVSYGFRAVWAVSLIALVVATASSFFVSGGVPWLFVFQRLEPLAGTSVALAVLARHLAPVGPGFDRVARWTGVSLALAAILVLATVPGTSLLAFAPETALLVYRGVTLVVGAIAMVMGVRRWRVRGA